MHTGRPQSLVDASMGRPGDDPIFALDAEAQRRAAAGERVVNATLGALMEDDGRLAIMPTVSEALGRVDALRAAAYAPIAGDPAFLAAVVADVFGDGPLAARAVAVATPGGTGAVHHAIVNYLDPGQALLTTNYFWGPYRTLATHTRRAVEVFPMFDADGAFDLEAFERGLDDVLRRQGRALVVLNFPCHNPTGYSLDAAEWDGVGEILRRAGERAPVALLVDLAYARYGAPGSETWVERLEPATQSCTLLVAWTASKSFAQYGARVGALIAVPPSEGEREAVRNALAFSCRGTWSNCNHLGLLAVTELLTRDDLRARVERDRARLKALLDERVAAFNEAAAHAGLRTPRYEGGFFVAVFTPDARRTAALAREHGVFVVPLEGAVRVALCSTPAGDVPRLVAAIALGVEEAS